MTKNAWPVVVECHGQDYKNKSVQDKQVQNPGLNKMGLPFDPAVWCLGSVGKFPSTVMCTRAWVICGSIESTTEASKVQKGMDRGTIFSLILEPEKSPSKIH